MLEEAKHSQQFWKERVVNKQLQLCFRARVGNCLVPWALRVPEGKGEARAAPCPALVSPEESQSSEQLWLCSMAAQGTAGLGEPSEELLCPFPFLQAETPRAGGARAGAAPWHSPGHRVCCFSAMPTPASRRFSASTPTPASAATPARPASRGSCWRGWDWPLPGPTNR